MSKIYLYWSTVAILLLIGSSHIVIAQQQFSAILLKGSFYSQNSNPDDTISAQEFDNQLHALLGLKSLSSTTASIVEAKLFQRLKRGQFVSDDGVLSVVNNRIILEQQQLPESKSVQLPKSEVLIKALITALYKRPMLVSALLTKLSDIYRQEGNRSEQASVSASAVELLKQLDIQTNELRVQNLLSTADAFYKLGNRTKADGLYVQVLSYPYEYILDSKADTLFQDCYRQAAIGLINSRQDNVTALEDIYLRPWAQIELGAYLQQIIKQAKERTQPVPRLSQPSQSGK